MASALEGKFVWYELTTPDPDAAERFYGAVLGWSARDAQVPGMRYSLFSIGGQDIAGMMAPIGGAPAMWLGYVCVDDIDAAYARLQESGGQTMMPVTPIPGVGRFAICVDPQGAAFALLEYAADFPKPTDPAKGIQGHGWWRELHTTDLDAAFAFYRQQFGWEEKDRMDMGPMGVYQIFGSAGGMGAGGLFNDGRRAPFWLFYFWVDDIDATQTAILAGGGAIANGPMEVPGGAWIIEATDPQGVTFAVVGDRKKT